MFSRKQRNAPGSKQNLIDICNIPMRLDDAGEQMKDPAFSDLVKRADGLILVVPEYNHGYPGFVEACARHESGGIHSQGGRDLRRVGRVHLVARA